jgi:ABC-2 type transport system permease protein
MRWMWRDTGYRILLLLGVLNVVAHTWPDVRRAGSDPSAARAAAYHALLVHSRLFLILLATIYAGELVWRWREVRLAPVLQTTPSPRWWPASGELLGTVIAQGCGVLLLVAGMHLVATAAAGQWIATPGWIVATLMSPALIAITWLALSVIVHVLVQQKIVAHLLLIAGWAIAVAVSGGGPDAVWQVLDWPPSPRVQAGLAAPAGDWLIRVAGTAAVSSAAAVAVLAGRRVG